jgi:Undecaprenyl-phosphate galactose phosphotransferase WbaP
VSLRETTLSAAVYWRTRPSLVAAARSCALLTADLAAFVVVAFMAFAADLAVTAGPAQRALSGIRQLGLGWHGWSTFLVLICLLWHFGARGHYSSRIPFWIELGSVIRATVVAFVADGIIMVNVYNGVFGYESMMRWVLFVPAALAARQATRAALDSLGLWSLRTILVGESSDADKAKAALESEPALGYEIVGVLDPAYLDDPGDEATWRRILKARDTPFVVVAFGNAEAAKERAVVAALSRARVPFALVPTFDGLPVLGFSQQYFFSHDIMLMVCRNNLARPLSRVLKLAFDQIVAALLLVLLSPLFLAIASLVRADGGSAFFGHKRIGMNGEVFRCLKFRTMVTNADNILRELLARDPEARAEWAATQKLRDDPRITGIGRYLRRTSLDELPQLLNVLRGEMSLVGPRPIVDAEVARYGKDISYYYETRPGMTGLWQVSGRSDASYQRRVQLDLWYVKNWTLWHDVAILLKTVPAVVKKDGAV